VSLEDAGYDLVAFFLYFGLVVLELVFPLALLEVRSQEAQRLVAFAHPAQLETQFLDLLLFLLY
jgi:fumarate reductase subunit D